MAFEVALEEIFNSGLRKSDMFIGNRYVGKFFSERQHGYTKPYLSVGTEQVGKLMGTR